MKIKFNYFLVNMGRIEFSNYHQHLSSNGGSPMRKVKLWTNQYVVIVLLSLVMFAAFYMITAGFPIFVSTISDNPAIAGIMTTTLMFASLITRFFASVIIQKVLFGVAFAIIHPIVQAWALTLVPKEKKATANSMLLIFIDFGLAIGSLGLGFLANRVGYGMTFSYSAITMIIILLLYLFGSRKVVLAKDKA